MGELVSYPSNGDSAHGWFEVPESGSGRGLVVIQEWWGIVPHIKDLAARFAREGFVVIAPDLYHGETTTEPDEAQKKMMNLDLPRAGKEIAGAARWLAEQDVTTGDKLGVVGFCMGGSLALWAGSLDPRIAAMVPFYPAFGWERMGPDWSAYAGKHVLMHLAEGDGGSGADHVQEANTRLTDAGATVTLHDYPGTHHAFFNDSRPEVYDTAAATEAWSRTLAFLHEHLG